MPAFTHAVVASGDEPMTDLIYNFGKNNPTPPKFSCSNKPYPLRSEWSDLINDPAISVVVIYADGEMREVVSFETDKGLLGLTVFKGFGDGVTPHPDGRAMTEYMLSVVRSMVPVPVNTLDKNPENATLYEELDVAAPQTSVEGDADPV